MPIIDPQTGQDVSGSRAARPDARTGLGKTLKLLFRAAALFRGQGPYVSSAGIQRAIDEVAAPWIPHAIQILRCFRAPDPWTGEAAAEWAVGWYSFEPNPGFRRMQQEWIASHLAKSAPADLARQKPHGVETGIETKGRCHLLPRMLAQRWRRGECEDRALPLLLRRIEPLMRRTDFTIAQKLIVIGSGYLCGIVGWPAAGGAVYFLVTGVAEGYRGLGALAAVFLLPFLAASIAHLLQHRRDRQVDRLVGDLLATPS